MGKELMINKRGGIVEPKKMYEDSTLLLLMIQLTC
jgi:hypothetical protein